jgi:hypothetical protein
MSEASQSASSEFRWELYTERSRQVIIFAQDEARTLDHHQISTAHVLLGLLREADGIAAQALRRLKVDVDWLRTETARFIPAEPATAVERLPFSAGAQAALKRALVESAQAGHDYVGTEHLLLALARDSSMSALRILERRNITETDLRSSVIALLSKPLRGVRVFLAHSSADKEEVRTLYRRLRQNGLAPWLDEEALVPGQDWELAIRAAVRGSDYVAVCLSQASTTRAGYVHKEIKQALDVADEQPEGSVFIVPVRLEECDVPDRLRHLHWVDLFSPAGYQRLLRAFALGPKS